MLELVKVDPAVGLHNSEIAERRERFGPNTFPEQPPRSFFAFMWDAAQDATLIILAIAAGLSLTELIKEPTSGWHDCVAILFAIFLCVFVGAYNDYSQSLQFRALNADKRNILINVVRARPGALAQAHARSHPAVSPSHPQLRDGRRDKVSVYDLVVGDIVIVSLGDQIPADGLLLNGQSVVVDESAMTGESDPLKKNPEAKPFMLSGCKISEGCVRDGAVCNLSSQLLTCARQRSPHPAASARWL